jgi:hypothetical protein
MFANATASSYSACDRRRVFMTIELIMTEQRGTCTAHRNAPLAENTWDDRGSNPDADFSAADFRTTIAFATGSKLRLDLLCGPDCALAVHVRNLERV